MQYRVAVNIDGVYGSQAKAAIKNFQRQNGLDADGIIGQYRSTYPLVCKGASAPSPAETLRERVRQKSKVKSQNNSERDNS